LNWPAMGANENVPDIFVEIDWMHGTDGGDHTHIPKLGALSAIAATFSTHGINIHFDVGNNYQGNSFIVPSAYAQGGDIIEENGRFLCPNTVVTNPSKCAFPNLPYSVL